MKRKMKRHPKDYAIGENEQLYMDMAAKGWLLRKRGAYFSYFEESEPQERCYRIEVASPAVLDTSQELPEEQVMLYEESGWQFVTRHLLVNVFTAPKGREPMEFYSDPRQQADTLKALRRQYTLCWVPGAVLFLFQLMMLSMVNGTGMGKLVSGFRISYVENTAFWILLGLVLVWAGCGFLHDAWSITKVYRRLKKGKYIEHSSQKKKYGYPLLSGVLSLCCLISLVLAAAQRVGKTVTDIPKQADGPYLLLQDFGLEGEHRSILQNVESNYVEHSTSLLGEHWKVYESMGNDSLYWIRQDVYQVGTEEKAAALAGDLMETAVFADGREAFQKAEIPGLDVVYYTDLEYVMVKGKSVCYMILSGTVTEASAPVLWLQCLMAG